MIGSLGWMEITIIVILALVVVGPSGLPKLGRSIGRAIRDFKREARELKDAVEMEVEAEDELEQREKKREATSSKSKSDESQLNPKKTKKTKKTNKQ